MDSSGQTDVWHGSRINSDLADPSPRRRSSKTAEYFTKIANGDYYCIVCRERTPSREVLLKKEKNGSTSRLWRHLKRVHPSIYRRIRPDASQPSVSDIFNSVDIPRQDITALTSGGSVEELLCFICRTKASFEISGSQVLERLISYHTQHDVSLPSSEIIKLSAFKKYEEGKSTLQHLLRHVRKVSLTVNAWSTKDQTHIIMITVHWIDDTWVLCERVIGVEEIVGPHSGDSMAEVLTRILKDFSLIDKISSITLNKANSSSSTLAASLEKVLKDMDPRFDKLYCMPCLTQTVYQIAEEGFKQFGILTTSSMPESIDELFYDISNPTQPSKESMLGTLVDRLRRAIAASQEPPERLTLYKVVCEELGISSKQRLTLDDATGWYSTYEMIVVALEKKQVLDKMTRDVMNEGNDDFSFTVNEWEFLKLLTGILSPFHDCIELLNRSKTVSASNALRILEALLSMVASYINDLDKLSSNTSDSAWNAEQLVSVKETYVAMNEKLVKYEKSLKKTLKFAIAVALDPYTKLSCNLSIERDFLYESLIRFLKEVDAEMTLNPNATTKEKDRDKDTVTQSWRKGTPQKGFNLIEEAIKSSQLKTRRDKMSLREELDEYFGEACIGGDSLTWWRDIGCLRFPRIAVLAKEYLSICAASSSFESIFAAGKRIVPYQRRNLNAESAAVLMTLKCWAWEEDPEDYIREGEQWDN